MSRGTIATVVFVALCVGTGLGMMLFAWSPLPQRAPSAAIQAPATARIAPTGTPIPVREQMAEGSRCHFRSNHDVWVDDIGLLAWNRAFANRDARGESQAWSLFQHFEIPANTPLIITARRGEIFQVQVLGGSLDGRRGWTDTNTRFDLEIDP